MSSIHGHEVLHMMQGHEYTEARLLAAIGQKFGSEAKFHNCSQQDLTAKQLVTFLKSKGKFMPTKPSEFTVDSDKIC